MEAWEISGYEDIFTVLSDFFNIFKVVKYISDKNFTLYITIFYFIIVLLIVLLSTFIYISFHLKNNAEKNYLVIEIFKMFGLLFNTCLIIPFYDILFINFDCKGLTSIASVCFSGSNFIHVIFSGIGLILILIFSYIFAFFYFEVKTRTDNSRARWTPSYDVTQALSKLVIVIFFRFCKDVSI